MKKARKVKIFGQNMKFFVDKGAKDEMDEATFARVILYGNMGERWHWNMYPVNKAGRISASNVKKAFMERKFIKIQ